MVALDAPQCTTSEEDCRASPPPRRYLGYCSETGSINKARTCYESPDWRMYRASRGLTRLSPPLYEVSGEERKGLQYKYSQMLGDQKISSVNVEDVCPMQFKHRHASAYMAAVCRRSQMPFQR